MLSRQCSISEILDLATTTIISTTNSTPTVNSINDEFENDAELFPLFDEDKKPSLIVKKKIHKTIHDFNPNPLLLSKKAIKARERKLKTVNDIKTEKTNDFETRPFTVHSLGGRQWQILQSAKLNTETMHNSLTSTTSQENSIDQDGFRISGSRQKFFTESIDAAPFRSSKFTSQRVISRQPNQIPLKDSTEALAAVATPHVTNYLLGGRQLKLLKEDRKVSFTVDPSKVKGTKGTRKKIHVKQKHGRVRKVLKGRRKLSSSESRQELSHIS